MVARVPHLGWPTGRAKLVPPGVGSLLLCMHFVIEGRELGSSMHTLST
jgi:hypothetical protein